MRKEEEEDKGRKKEKWECIEEKGLERRGEGCRGG